MTSRDTWQANLHEELAFWDAIMRTKGLEWPDEFRERLDLNTPFGGDLRALVDPELHEVHVLDVGAGPFTTLGKRWEGRKLHITAIDPLADKYKALLAKYGLTPPVPTLVCHGEELDRLFPRDSFDLVHARNSLDHSYDPVGIIKAMVAVAKPGARIVLTHVIREADREKHQGLHQWNFFPEDGDFLIEGAGKTVNVSHELEAVADVAVEEPNVWYPWFRVVMRKL